MNDLFIYFYWNGKSWKQKKINKFSKNIISFQKLQ